MAETYHGFLINLFNSIFVENLNKWTRNYIWPGKYNGFIGPFIFTFQCNFTKYVPFYSPEDWTKTSK